MRVDLFGALQLFSSLLDFGLGNEPATALPNPPASTTVVATMAGMTASASLTAP